MAPREDARQIDDRPREILRMIVRSYVTSGEPVGSRTLAKSMDWRLSPATIRNIMSDLEELGWRQGLAVAGGSVAAAHRPHLAPAG